MREFTTAFLMLMAVTVLAGCLIAGPDDVDWESCARLQVGGFLCLPKSLGRDLAACQRPSKPSIRLGRAFNASPELLMDTRSDPT
jgi:hypothetical protein